MMATMMDIDEAKHHLAQLLNLAKSGTGVFISENMMPNCMLEISPA